LKFHIERGESSERMLRLAGAVPWVARERRSAEAVAGLNRVAQWN